MEFGRLESIEGIDFSLPPDHPGVKKILGGKRSNALQVYVGCPEWVNDGFIGKIYPLHAKAKDYVKYYAQQFNSIELNASHYRVPDINTIQRWAGVVPEGFKFSPKVHQSISHSADISKCRNLIYDFYESVLHFGPHLGTSFLQLPPHFDTARLDLLLDFLEHCPLRDLAIELRHHSWFAGTEQLNTLCNYLYKTKFCLAVTDVAGRRDVLHGRLTNTTAFIRFVANNLHPTDYTRLDAWAERLTEWIGAGLETLYFFIHTPDKGLCPELALYFIGQLNKGAGLDIRPPELKAPDANALF
ncbi:MAG: DUF72 domain-containing protein [Bacteroidia bacterium]